MAGTGALYVEKNARNCEPNAHGTDKTVEARADRIEVLQHAVSGQCQAVDTSVNEIRAVICVTRNSL